jgi:hypothetical protein
MKFRDYCLVIMGNADKNEVLVRITGIAETKPNVLDAKGIIITTFISGMKPIELTNYFKSFNFNFLIFDLNESNSGFNFTKDEINDGLFGFLHDNRDEFLKDKTEEFLHELSATTSDNVSKFITNDEFNLSLPIDDIPNLSRTERNNWMNIILGKGVDKLSEYDKKLLDKLSD